jgi:hypothetical protein
MSFEKSKDYLESIYNFLFVLNEKANKLSDNKLKQICKLILNYLINSCNDSKLTLKELTKNENFDMKPVYEYISDNSIKIMDLNNLQFQDIDVKNPLDIERFVLSHIYYIYENN